MILAEFFLFDLRASENEDSAAERVERAGKPETNKEILIKYKDADNIVVYEVKENEDYQKILDGFNKDSRVEYAEPNFTYRASIIPTDTYYNKQWYLEKIKAPSAWDIARKTDDITIAIIDSGVQIDHPDLRDNIWVNNDEISDNGIDDDKNGFIDDRNGWDFVNGVSDPSSKFKDGFTEAGVLHGTVVAGIAAASGNNAAGITGVTWGAKIMPLKALGDAGEGNTNEVVKAIDYAIANGADIINLSFVGFGFSKTLDNAIKRAYDSGLIIVAAAGNEQGESSGYSLDEKPMYPVCHDGNEGENRVIGVAATDTIDQKAVFSSYGFDCVDISAPGISIYSTVIYSPNNHIGDKYFNNYYDGYWSGTSMATPMVSAAFALAQEANPRLNRGETVNVVISTADNINRLNPNYLNQLGSGRINLYQAVAKAQNELTAKSEKILVSPQSAYLSQIKITDKDGNVDFKFEAYAPNYSGGVKVSSGDVNGDGLSEIVTGAGAGGGPHIRVFSGKGELLSQFFAYSLNFRGGVNLAICDIGNDGISEIITGAGFGGGPQIRIFDYKGNAKGQFFAYNKTFRGGVNVACGDVDGDGQSEIVAGAGKTGGPQIRIFSEKGVVEGQFFAYNKTFRGGVNLVLGDIDGGIRNNKLEIITVPATDGGPHIRIFNNYSTLMSQFFAYDKIFRGGVNIASCDIDNDGLTEIISGAGPGGTPHVRVFEPDGKIIGSFLAFEQGFSGGVNVGIIKY